MKKKQSILVLLALVMILGAWITPALAYFTTYARAKGGYTVSLETHTEIDESYSDWKKTITVRNTEGKPVYVRARAFAGSDFTLSYSGENWHDGGDGWWYYDAPLAEGESSAALTAAIGNIPEADEGVTFNVAVVYESTPVQYKADGTAYADWTMTLDRKEAEG